jgi:serine phosphatase RsbU (regulator of sigma subunit)
MMTGRVVFTFSLLAAFLLFVFPCLSNDWQSKYEEALRAGDVEKAAYFAYQCGLEYKNHAKTADAVSYFQKAIEHGKHVNNNKILADSFYSLGLLTAQAKDNGKAVSFFESALKYYHNFNDRSSYALASLDLVKSYVALKDFKNAKAKIQKTIYIAESLSKDVLLIETYNLAASVFEKAGDKDNALLYQRKSLDKQKETQQKEAQELAGMFEEKQRETEMELNRKSGIIREREKALKALENEKNLIEEINARKAKEIEDLKKAKELEDQIVEAQRRTIEQGEQITKLLVGAGIISVIFMVFLVGAYINKRRSNNELKSKNEEISAQKHEIDIQRGILEERNLQITDSIRYAEKIQKGVLADPSGITPYVSGFFVIYRPKDIVSGDFYWFGHYEEMAFAAAVDCTGHGVPGAFMSMIGNTILNEILYQKHIFSPAEILENLHNAIRKALKQENKGNDDGMDLCLCKIEREQGFDKKITFSGAKRPLYFFSNGKIGEIKGDKKSVGGRQKEEKRTFTNRELTLHNGDMIFLTTDGFADQPNSENEKFGTPNLLALLAKVAEYQIYEQEHYIVNELDKHQNGTQQRDDITLIGIKM